MSQQPPDPSPAPYQGPYAPTGPVPPAPPPQVSPPKKNRRVLVTLASVLVAILVAIGVRMVIAGLNGTSSAQAGDCIQYTETGNRTKVVDCGSAEATHKIFGVTEELRACADVAGTQIALEVGRDRVLCFGDKNLDPANAINAVKKGDCVAVSGQTAKKSACTTGTYPVLEVVKDRVKTPGDDNFELACTDVEGAEGAYAWSISTGENEAAGTWDRIYCLGPEKS